MTFKNAIFYWNTIFTLSHHCIYIKKNKFTSHKKYLFGLVFSGNPKKKHTDQVYCKFFALSEKKQLTNKRSQK